MKISKYTWEKGWIWDCPKSQSIAWWIETNIAIDIRRKYKGEHL